jgi:DNA polymerase III, beta subunit
MQFEISREALIKPLQLVTGVVERRQTLPVLANVLLVLEGQQLSLTGTDLEVELVGRVQLDNAGIPGEITVPARKLMDICKSLPDDATLKFELDDGKAVIRFGRSRFSLATLPANDFPSVEESQGTLSFSIPQKLLKTMIDSTAFAMAQQDVRYYLNGLLMEVNVDSLRVVATDGHRLALHTEKFSIPGITGKTQVIIPRKGILELARLLSDTDEPVELTLGTNHIRARTQNFTFTSKLVDGKFPDYDRVLPKGGDKVLVANRGNLRNALSRTAILSNEKFRGIRLVLEKDELKILANNPEQEEAEEIVSVEYTGSPLEIGFNVSYLVDVLSVISTDNVQMVLSDANSSALIHAGDGAASLYVVMPMRL